MYELSWDNPYEIQKVTFVPVGHRFAEIDAEDWERVSKYNWYLQKHKSGHQYAQTFVYPQGKQTGIYMHRMILDLQEKGLHVDHRNHEDLDNRKSKLRVATLTQNLHNQRRQKPKKISPYKGVRFHPYCGSRGKVYPRTKPWEVWICVYKKSIYLGAFTTKELAAEAYNEAAEKYFGEFAYLNKL